MSSPRQEVGRPRAKSALSFSSNKSNRSHRSAESFRSGSIGKIDLTETSKEKRHLHTKADPNLATNEAQPSTIAQEESNLASLRGVQHKDVHGNLITDPDRSNPTRHRMERPLDTIRGFEEAWSGSYNRRTSSYGRPSDRPESRGTGVTGDFSRRSSAFFPGHQNNPPAQQGRGFQEGGYYGSDRNSMARPDSFIDQYSGPPSQFQGQGRGYRPNPNVRNNSDPMLYGAKQRGVYPSHSYQQSYDTVLTSGSHQTEPWGNSTDPSSENSSMDRIQPMPKVNEHEQSQMSETYGLNSFGGNQQIQLNEYSQGMNQPGSGRNGYGHNHSGSAGLNRFQSAPESRPMPPPKAAAGPRVPIKLDGPSGSPLTQEVSRQVSRESNGNGKRKSWLMRRFSKR